MSCDFDIFTNLFAFNITFLGYNIENFKPRDNTYDRIHSVCIYNINMNDCICGDRALYLCKPHQEALCKNHKSMHEEGNQSEHIYEKLGNKLSAKRLAIIIESFIED